MDTHLSDENVSSCIDWLRSCCVHDSLEEPSDLLHDHLHDSQMVENGDAATEEDDCRKNLNKHTPVTDVFVKKRVNWTVFLPKKRRNDHGNFGQTRILILRRWRRERWWLDLPATERCRNQHPNEEWEEQTQTEDPNPTKPDATSPENNNLKCYTLKIKKN